MKTTIRAKTDIEFKVPAMPTHILTTVGQMPIEAMSESAIEDLFEAMKQNTLAYIREKGKTVEVPVKTLASKK